MHPENKSALLEIANDVHLDARQRDQVAGYIELIEHWNERTNLVSRQDVRRIVSRHLRESFWFCLPDILDRAETVLDLGSGAGFPGVAMKILQPGLRLTLLDSRKMKARFLTEAVRHLGWPDAQVYCERAENLPALHPGLTFQLIVCRAVAKLDQLWLWSAPLLDQGGRLAALKGGDLEVEIGQLKKRHHGIRCEVIAMPQLPHDPDAGRKMIMVWNS